MISNCGHDENGNYHGGKAGDQTEGEWEVRGWYSRPWNCVLRHPSLKVRETIATLAREAANNNMIGYDQYQRTTFYTALKAAGWRPSNIITVCETDCSAGVAALVIAAGHLLGVAALQTVSKDCYTGNLRATLKNAGFEVLTESKYLTSDNYLLPGDILLYEGHHTAINLDTGKEATVKYDYENLGWNEDKVGWWYAYGHNKGEYHVNNAVRIFCPRTGEMELYFFDTEGYCVKNPVIETEESGELRYIRGDRVK